MVASILFIHDQSIGSSFAGHKFGGQNVLSEKIELLFSFPGSISFIDSSGWGIFLFAVLFVL